MRTKAQRIADWRAANPEKYRAQLARDNAHKKAQRRELARLQTENAELRARIAILERLIGRARIA